MKSRKLFFIAAATAMAATSIVASAAWTASGSGSGSAKAISAQNVTVGTASVTGDLYPGKTGGTLKFTVTNPNPYKVKITGISTGAGTVTGCTTPAVTFSAITVPSDGTEILDQAGGTNPSRTYTFSVANMGGTSSADCAGADLTLTSLSVTAESYVPVAP